MSTNNTNYIVYAVREGYEIKVWVKDISREVPEEYVIELGKVEFKRVGVELRENERFDIEEF